jgi:hypothetical protein
MLQSDIQLLGAHTLRGGGGVFCPGRCRTCHARAAAETGARNRCTRGEPPGGSHLAPSAA